MLRIKTIFQLASLLLLTTFIACNNGKQNAYTISTSGMEEYEECNFVLIKLNKNTVDGFDTLAMVTVKDGSFMFSGHIDSPHKVYFSFDKDKKIMGKGGLILEKGNLKLKKNGEGYFTEFYIEKGKYNSIVTNSWLLDKEYKSLYNDFAQFISKLKDEDYENEDIMKKYYFYKSKMKKQKESISLELVRNHEDPFVRLLALSNSGLSLTEGLKVLVELESKIELKESQMLKEKEEAYKTALEREARASELKIGKQIKDFTADDLSGNKINLNNILEKNKFVLVEFWASWCAPCRNEIPHMKEAYENYHNKGFEIISFTLDNSRKLWKKASDKEQIPWINVGDLKACKSPVVQMYGVNGVPVNFLVSTSGEIIALNLRGTYLDEKLRELLK